VVGVTGFFGSDGTLGSVGIQCAICHSTVDDALLPGVGNRLDGWANRDLDIGKIAALAPNLQPVADLLGVDVATVKAVLESWEPGKFDAELLLDGKGFRDGNLPAATLIPPAFGLSGVNLHTWPGWGGVTYLNAFVANIEMHGTGHVLRSPPERSGALPGRGEGGLREHPQPAGPHHREARRPALLPALDPGSDAARGQLRRGGRRARQGHLRGQGTLRDVPRAPALHGAGLEPASTTTVASRRCATSSITTTRSSARRSCRSRRRTTWSSI
jgi:hypothetical protein